MSHYRPNLRDLEFNLFEVLGRDRVLGQGEYADLDAEIAQEMLTEVARLAVEDLGPSLVESDRTPPTFDPTTYSATLPESFKRAYRAYLDGEWWRTDVPAERANCAPLPGLTSMHEIVVPKGIFRSGKTLPGKISAFGPLETVSPTFSRSGAMM